MKDIRKKSVFMLMLMMIISILTVAFAKDNSNHHGSGSGGDVHVNPYYSVRNGAIKWTGGSKYSGNLDISIGFWNSLGKVSIQKATVFDVADLVISDVSNSAVGWDGQYIYYSNGADTIKYNTYYLDQSDYTSSRIIGVMTHELGHAVGLGDHYAFYYKLGGTYEAVMYGYSFDLNGNYIRPTYVTTHDREDYNTRWP